MTERKSPDKPTPVRDEGRDAYLAGEDRAACPFLSTAMQREWLAGYDEAAAQFAREPASKLVSFETG